VVFHQAVSAAPWTVPSHMAMWTVPWPTRHGLVNKLRPDSATGAPSTGLRVRAATAAPWPQQGVAPS
jgi:hypothetical protein